jgi:solute carrier family 25 protein 14/30
LCLSFFRKKLYDGFADATVKVLSKEGPAAFYRGFFPMWARFAPQATLQLLIFDNLLSVCGFKPI